MTDRLMETKDILHQLDQLKEEIFPLARRATMLYALLQVRGNLPTGSPHHHSRHSFCCNMRAWRACSASTSSLCHTSMWLYQSLACVQREYQFTLPYFYKLFDEAIGGDFPPEYYEDTEEPDVSRCVWIPFLWLTLVPRTNLLEFNRCFC